MATARLLPSGAYRTQVKKTINGKVVCKSFTVHPKDCKGNARKAKDQSEMLARQWRLSAEDSEVYGIKVRDALEQYIQDRSKVLSPSTITNYKRLIPLFESVMDICVDEIKTADIQALVNEWSISVRAKTCRNRISFLLSALDYVECDKKFRIRYPNSPSKEIKAPDTEDVKMLLDNAPDILKPILYLAAFGALRRGEIAALKQKDISRDMCTVHVHADMVLDGNKWIYKPFPKNALAGVVQLPKFIIDLLPCSEDPEAYVFNMNPNMISHRYEKLRAKLGFPFNFHSLRHFAASFRSDLGIPRKYIEEVGRWESGSVVLERVYDNTLTSTRKKYTQIANRYIEENFKEKQA
ncbi:MAG: tyrosine-type recombinase/integrase [Clostridiales bacterium]|nr:tyrosine-type recombinase/integrase [Clostridiales bacterium]MBQ1572617.1 tyrosine-type recombinase/integrase [Clostridiales bacterium]